MTARFRNTLFLLPLLIGAPFIGGCNSDSSDAIKLSETPAEALTPPFGLASTALKPGAFNIAITTRDANDLEAIEFSRGEQILIELTVSNLVDDAAQLALPDPGYPAYCVRKIGETDCRWHSRHGFFFPQVIVDLDFESAQVRNYRVNYEQLDNDGQPLESGAYEVRGVVGYHDEDLLGSAWHQFVIL
ncbi:MAG: hypothetical protein HKN49_03355 [Gammaproteobacteria bacterium]|nr:hypothetical protein [Gammaproteobacteria bacterium]